MTDESCPGTNVFVAYCAVHGMHPDAQRKRGRVYDPGSGRWYKDGFAPFQLAGPIAAWCGACGRESLTITERGAFCVFCSPGLVKGD